MRHEASQHGRLRNTKDDLPFVLLVRPDGQIVVKRYQVNMEPAKCQVEKTIGPGGRVLSIRITGVKSDAYEAGWRLLDQLCAAEGREKDCETIYEWHARAQQKGSHRRRLAKLKDEYLPEAVLQMRADAGREFDPLPPPQKKAKTGARARVSGD